jgi:hypothetical protein
VFGTLLNVAAILAGTLIGALLGDRLPARVRDTAMNGLGLVVLVMGAQLALKTGNTLILLGSVVIGGAIGGLIGIEDGLERLGDWFEARLSRRPGGGAWGRVAEAFVSSSLVFCVGPMTILGSIQDGLTGDYSLLAVKSALDGIGSVAFASTLGPGVVLSAGTVLVYQGILSLLAGGARQLLTDPVVQEMTAAGGVLILGIGLRLLEIKRLPVGNLLPSLAVAPILVALT